MKSLGPDIVPHRKRMNEEKLDEKKDLQRPIPTGFPLCHVANGVRCASCSTIHLDKPMRNHALMQTIARANRVFPGKRSGLIVDYADVFASLEKGFGYLWLGQGE